MTWCIAAFNGEKLKASNALPTKPANDAATYEQIWKGRTIDELLRVVGKTAAGTDRIAPAGPPVWNTSSIDTKRNLLNTGTGGNYSLPVE